MTNRNHVGVGVDVFLEELWVAVVGAESGRQVIKRSRRHTALGGINQRNVLRITRPEFIQYGSAKGMDPAQLAVGSPPCNRVVKSPGAGGAARPKFVCRTHEI